MLLFTVIVRGARRFAVLVAIGSRFRQGDTMPRGTAPVSTLRFRGGPRSGFLDGVGNGRFQIADAFLQLAFGLFSQPLGLLLLAPDQLSGFFLNLAAEVFQFAFDLILVGRDGQDRFPSLRVEHPRRVARPARQCCSHADVTIVPSAAERGRRAESRRRFRPAHSPSCARAARPE
jgi:hypothetical protein